MKRLFIIILLFPIFLLGQNREKMIIVSYFSFIPQLSVYVEAKSNDNIDCVLISVDSTDNFSSIKIKIDEIYKNFNAYFLLLVGDNEHIPAYKIEEGLSDIHYAFENENNPNPRMSVGRFSVETHQDLQTMIDRSITRKPFSKHAIGIASYHKSELTGKRDYEQVQFMGQQLQYKGFTSVSELFSGLSSNNPTYQDVITTLQSGATWLNYAGNGSYDGWNTTEFNIQHIDNLPDNIELPIIFSASCLGGHFANRTCFAEKWLRSTKNGNPTGAVAAIMSSNLTDWDATLSAMLVINENMPPTSSNCRLGNLYLQGYRYIIDSMQRPTDAQCWLLFGDPSLWVYPTSNENNIFEKRMPVPQLIIYPNPTTGQLRIKNYELRENTNVEIYDIVGKKLSIFNFQLSTNEIDISHLANGIYFLKIGEKMFKVIKNIH
jgi:hypothetical protein